MSTPRLRLTDDRDTEAPPIYRFPTEFARGAQTLTDDDPASMDALELAGRIEEALDDLQARLDEVQEDLAEVYHFPDPDDWRPTAA